MCCMVFILNLANASERLFLGEQFLSAHHTSRYSLGAGFSDRFAEKNNFVCLKHQTKGDV